MCVPQRWKCDGDKDCPDGADESVKAGCSECDNHQITRWNDLSSLCCDWTEKQNTEKLLTTKCSSSLPVYTNNTCDENEFVCQNRQCIPKHFVCDHDIDCSDGSDESPECGECVTLWPGRRSSTYKKGFLGIVTGRQTFLSWCRIPSMWSRWVPLCQRPLPQPEEMGVWWRVRLSGWLGWSAQEPSLHWLR